MNTTSSAQASALSYSARRRGIAFSALLFAFAMELLDSTIVNVAIPSISADLGATGAQIQWMVAGYAMSFAVLLISGGRLGDIYGYKKLFLIGMASFTAASLGCGLAGSAEHLVVARLLQGGAAALMSPQVLALGQILYQPSERVRIFSIFGVVGGLSAVLGPILGGALIQADFAGLGWRSIFLINIPVGLIGLVAAWFVLPAGRSTYALRLDPLGTLLVSATVVALILPLIQGQEQGWPLPLLMLCALSIPLAVLSWWVMRSRAMRGGSSLVELSLFREHSYTVGLATSLLFSTAVSGFFIALTLTLQVGLGYTPFKAALINIPFALGVGQGVSILSQKILPKLGRSVLTIGACVMSASIALLLMVVAMESPSLLSLCITLFGVGIGMGMVLGPLQSVALARVDVGHAGAAGGLLSAVQQFGSALGIAVIGTIFLRPGVSSSATPTHAAFSAAAYVTIMILLAVAVLTRQLPKRSFDSGSGAEHGPG